MTLGAPFHTSNRTRNLSRPPTAIETRHTRHLAANRLIQLVRFMSGRPNFPTCDPTSDPTLDKRQLLDRTGSARLTRASHNSQNPQNSFGRGPNWNAMGALTRNAAGPESGGANGHGGGSNASAVLELVANLSL